MNIILITGASSGIGYQTAQLLAKQGNKVYGAARRIERIEPLRADGVIPLKLDLTNEASMQTAIDTIISNDQRIDVLINNAGYGSYGAVEDVSMDEARRQFEVNLFGVARLVQLVLPHMRHQGGGRIINTSSMGGRLTTYFGAWYHATKYALEAFSDALRMETKQFGIDVVLIEPGGIKTNWGKIAADHLATSAKGGAYEAAADQAAKAMRKQYSGKLMSDPRVISRAMLRAVDQRHPRARYLVGFGAKPMVLLHNVLPTRMFDSLIMRIM